jgi:hypothetical protein
MSGDGSDHWKTFGATLVPNLVFNLVQLAVQIVWKRRMIPERQARVWTWPQWGLILLNPTCIGAMFAFAWITRRHRGFGEGARALGIALALFAGVYAITVLADSAYRQAVGLPAEDATM